MNWHPTDEDLILHFYGEGRDDEPRIDRHLQACPSCHELWTELGDTLRLVDSAAVPEPDSGFERVLWARVQRALPAPAPRTSWWSARLLWPAAAAAAVVVAVVVTGRVPGTFRSWRAQPAPAAELVVPAVKTADSGHVRERVLLTALDDHFEQAKQLLVELMNASSDETDFAFERAAAGDLVASGRVYRVTARQFGDLRLAGMLDDLEAVLVDVARSSDRLDRGELKSLRARIDDSSLLFKVRAVSNEVREREKKSVNSE